MRVACIAGPSNGGMLEMAYPSSLYRPFNLYGREESTPLQKLLSFSPMPFFML